MTDPVDPTNGSRLPVPRPEAPAPVERFTAPPSARRFGLSAERAAAIVRQSGSARSVGLLSVLIVVVFLTGYYFYDTGVPGVLAGRQAAAQTQLQVTQVANGYALFQANCARCHGAQGQGLIGPALNDQVKLSAHLNPQYIRNVLTVGGRYVCGNPDSLMPVWADTNGGPLNYEQINDIIDFITAPNTTTFEGVDPATGKTVTLHGWKDPTFTMPAGSTPFPACWSNPGKGSGSSSGGAGAAPSAAGSNLPGATNPAPAGSGATSTTINLSAQGIKFSQTQLTAPANQPFAIAFNNQDSVLHNVVIQSSSGQTMFSGQLVQGPAQTTYQVNALAPGTYTFICEVHPQQMTGTLTVK